MKFLGLFEGYGIELEYMIVEPQHLDIRPISDEILKDAAGLQVSDFEDGDITWSNELVLHVIELKTTGPVKTLANLEESFGRSLKRMTSILQKHDARLMPTAMHPLMNPSEMRLWPHDNKDIYEIYDRIFDCRGHGWSNLQSMHINLPFRTDDEFTKLHGAIRFLLPILPAISASSPIVEGRMVGPKDNRLVYYQKNQNRIPSITGLVIPEPVNSIADYQERILETIYRDISEHDPAELLRDDWLNSRGAIARFGRQTIEIRVIDLQETHRADLAIADFIVAALKVLIAAPTANHDARNRFTTEKLKLIFDAAILYGEAAPVIDAEYLRLWGAPTNLGKLSHLWRWILEETGVKEQMTPAHTATIEQILKEGSLATRLWKALGDSPSRLEVQRIYHRLCDCLDQEKLFLP